MFFTACALLTIAGLILASNSGKDRWLLPAALGTLMTGYRGYMAEDPDLVLASVAWLGFWGYLLLPWRKWMGQARAPAEPMPRIYTRSGEQPLLYVGISKVRLNGVDAYEGRILGTRIARKGPDLGALRLALIEEAREQAKAMVERFTAAQEAGDPGAYTHLVPSYTQADLYRLHTIVPTITVRSNGCMVVAEFLEVA